MTPEPHVPGERRPFTRRRWGRAAACAAVAAALLACAPAPTAPAEAIVDLRYITIDGPAAGILTITGRPGAVKNRPVTTLTLTVVREGGVKAESYRLTHLGDGPLPVASAFASVAADGSFPATRLGSADRPVKLGDELNLTPQDGVVQAGPTVEWELPAAVP